MRPALCPQPIRQERCFYALIRACARLRLREWFVCSAWLSGDQIAKHSTQTRFVSALLGLSLLLCGAVRSVLCGCPLSCRCAVDVLGASSVACRVWLTLVLGAYVVDTGTFTGT